MEKSTLAQKAALNGVSVDHACAESFQKKSRFRGWRIKICDRMNHLRKFLYKWWTRQYFHILRVKGSYKKLLKKYNVNHVLEKTAGENNLLGEGSGGKVERYKVTAENVSLPKVKIPVYSTNDNEGKSPKDYHETPALHTQEIAYKRAGVRRMFSRTRRNSAEQRVADYCHSQEQKALAALDHPNIIKPVIIEGDAWQAESMTVIEVRSLSEEEKQDLALSEKEKRELAVAMAKNDVIPEDDPIDFDFEVVESVETSPAGIPLPLVHATLMDKMATGLSPEEKDNVVRGMIGAVAHAHQRGYVHLDIKPANILQKGDDWLLADWGFAHHYSDMHKGSMDFIPVCSIVGNGIFFGTTSYLSPQMYARSTLKYMPSKQKRSIREAIKTGSGAYPLFQTDARAADAYSLGIVLFELLTGVNITPAYFTRGFLRNLEEGFQKKVDSLLKKHQGSLGKYYEIVSLLLRSKCSERISVVEAEDMLRQIPISQHTTGNH